jgi:hypothetical protein
MKLSKITPADLVALGLMAALGVTLLGIGGAGGGSGRTVVVRSLKGETVTQDLGKEAHVEIEGLIGTTEVSIGPEGVAVLESPCPHKICVGKGRVLRAGDWILCLPNGIIVEITGEADYDGVTP